MKRISVRKVTCELVQQWRCLFCKKSYTFRKNKRRIKFTDVFIKEAVADFVQGRSSFAVIKERKYVSVGTLSRWVNKYGSSCMSPVEISESMGLKKYNKWSGILLLDGKYLNRRMILLLAVDFTSLDIVSWMVVKAETKKNYIHLINLVEKCGYKIKAIVSDKEPAILALTRFKRKFLKGTRRYPRPGIPPVKAVRAKLEGIPHQLCLIHVQREIKKSLAKVETRRRQMLLTLVNKTLFSKKLSTAERYKKKLILKLNVYSSDERMVAGLIIDDWEHLTTHHKVKVGRRRVPISTNNIENVISYLNSRLKTLRRLRNMDSARAITNLIIVNFRCKPLVNTKNKLKRGKSPLSLVTGENRKFDWMELIRKSCS